MGIQQPTCQKTRTCMEGTGFCQVRVQVQLPIPVGYPCSCLPWINKVLFLEKLDLFLCWHLMDPMDIVGECCHHDVHKVDISSTPCGIPDGHEIKVQNDTIYPNMRSKSWNGSIGMGPYGRMSHGTSWQQQPC